MPLTEGKLETMTTKTPTSNGDHQASHQLSNTSRHSKTNGISVKVEEMMLKSAAGGQRGGATATTTTTEGGDGVEFLRNRLLELYLTRALVSDGRGDSAALDLLHAESGSWRADVCSPAASSSSDASRDRSPTPASSSDSQPSLTRDSAPCSGRSTPVDVIAASWSVAGPSTPLSPRESTSADLPAVRHTATSPIPTPQSPGPALAATTGLPPLRWAAEGSRREDPYKLFHAQDSWYADIGKSILGAAAEQRARDVSRQRPVLAPGYGRPSREPWYARLGKNLLDDAGTQLFGPQSEFDGHAQDPWHGVNRRTDPLAGGRSDAGSSTFRDGDDSMTEERGHLTLWDLVDSERMEHASRRTLLGQAGNATQSHLERARLDTCTPRLNTWSLQPHPSREAFPASPEADSSLRRLSVAQALPQSHDSIQDSLDDASRESVKSPEEGDRSGKPYCVFCKKNGWSGYRNHTLKDAKGLVNCPRLQKLTCPYCGATGKRAHTITYCPKAAGDGASLETMITCRRKVHKKSHKKTVLSRLSKFLDSRTA